MSDAGIEPGPHALEKSSEKLLSIGSGAGPATISYSYVSRTRLRRVRAMREGDDEGKRKDPLPPASFCPH